MAEGADNEDKTFDPTPRRREEAREQGRYAFSQDLGSSSTTFAGFACLMFLGKNMGSNMLSSFRTDLGRLRSDDLTPNSASEMLTNLFGNGLTVVGGFFAVLLVVAVIAGIVQAGFHISPERLGPDFSKFDPTSGVKRIISTANVVKGLLAILKVIMLSWVAYALLEGKVGSLLSLGHDRLTGAASTAWYLILRIAVWMAAVIFLLGIVDFLYQFRRFETSLKMTREEYERENKEEEGDPQFKARRKQLARERSRRKMLSNIPKATVVVTNPTHFAVALRYEQGRDVAPMVVAKGAGSFARRMSQLARDNGVPVLEKPELARALFAAVREDQPIPPGLFLAVAEVIAFVFKLKRGLVTAS